MHKLVLKTFNFLKNVVYFLRILTMFFLMLHLLLWIQNLINGNFVWLTPFKGFLNIFISIGESITKDSINLFGALFEYKYMIAVGIYVGFYYICNFFILLLDGLEDKYDDVHRYVKKSQENSYNISLKHQQVLQESQYNSYKIFITTSLKKKFSHPELGYNLEEQNQLMNKFLISKTGVVPVKSDGGFVYSFNNFNDVDSILYIMFKLIKSNSPLDYVICLQVIEGGEQACMNALRELGELKHQNKISMFANSAYRYRFNKCHRYGVSQIGLFQRGNDTIEVHEFIEI